MKYFRKDHPATQIVLAVIFIAFFAQIEIVLPINKNGIPITGQTFAILIVGFFLGIRKSVLAVFIYLILGIAGLPVLAGGSGGVDVLYDDSIGFLVGFLFGAAATGYFGRIGWGESFFKCFIGMVIGTLIITLCGLVPLTVKYGFDSALKYGFYPFVWGALIKTILGATIPPIYHNLIKGQ